MAANQRGERARLQEVADRAGVSASTVSLVLAHKAERRRISADTRARVQKAAEELNYAPNLLTRSLKRGRTHIISFFSTFRHREWGDIYMDRVASAIETAGGEFGYDILVHCNFQRSPKEIYQFLNGGLADGLILFAPEKDDPLLELLRRSSLPVVLFNGRDPLGQYSSAGDDVEAGIKVVADQILAHGHRRIAALGSLGPDVRDSALRISLLRNQLSGQGITLDEDSIVWADRDPLPAIRRLMGSPNPPSLLFCWHDWMAYKALEACDALGIQSPAHLSLIGYDGIHWPSTSKHIAASIAVDLRAIAVEAVRLLDQAISHPGAPITESALPIQFSPGTTLAPFSSLQRSTL